MLKRIDLVVAILSVAICGPLSSAPAQVFDSITAASADPDFSVQGEYVGEQNSLQVIAKGDGEFEIVVYALGLPGAGWDRTPPRRLDGDADTVAQLVESMKLTKIERTSPTLGAVPPSDAIILFDGSQQSLTEHWEDGAKRTDDGFLFQGATTRLRFGNYRLHLEFQTPFMPTASGQGRGNSGVYHQGRYETQVLDSFGLEGKNNESGGIYSVRAPDLNMCLPPLSWQTYDVEFNAATFDEKGNKSSPATITVSLNGVPVQTGVAIPSPTTAAPLPETPDAGPIHLQDHGNPVRYRNIWLVPRDLAKESRRPIVAGYDRFYADADPKLIGGKLLIESLGCKACHLGGTSNSYTQGPNLDEVGRRVRHDHLLRYVASPRHTKVGTTMPDVWQGLSEEQRQSAAAAITSFLVSGKPTDSDHVGTSEAAERGKDLYHSLGCVACHAPMDGNAIASVSIPLGDLTTKYTLGSLTRFLFNPVEVRPCGRMPRVVGGASDASDIATFLLKEIVLVPGAEMVRRRVYPGKWEKLPNVDSLKAAQDDKIDGFKIDDIEGTFAASYDTFLQILEPGNYTFRLSSDDGARLVLDGKTIIDHDGVHPESEKSASVTLEAGVIPIRVLYFEGGGQRALNVSLESVSMGKTSLVAMVAASREGKPTNLLPSAFRADESLVTKGKGLFISHGCANCHRRSDVVPGADQSIVVKPLKDCQSNAGCLADKVPNGVPNYDLTAVQKQRIASALHLADEATVDDAAQLHDFMLTMNCYACHARGVVGGPDSARNAYFATTTPEMGDESRLPPNLHGVGDKLNDDYLAEVIANGADERPYMKTRMPAFGNATPNGLAATIARIDRRDEGHDGSAIESEKDELLANGRLLCGNDGLACIKCHTFAGVGLPGIQAIDMLRMTKRLRRDWFERYLLNPQAYRPGTRMPASFPDGKSVLIKVADGRPADQIEAMWTYLLQEKDARPPLGLSPDAIELKALERPLIYRNFFSDVSTRGIAVGYPEAINLIWDAERMTLSKVWKNAFIDASRHWSGRGEGSQGPLGDAVITLDRMTPVATLVDPTTAWPTVQKKDESPKFLGYSLDKSGKPTFRYRTTAVEVEDKVTPMDSSSGPRRFLREFQISGQSEVSVLVAAGRIKLGDDATYSVNDSYRVRLVDSDGDLLTFGDTQELRVTKTLHANESKATVSFEVSW